MTSSSSTLEWIDISVPIRPGMVHWPDNPAVSLERERDLARGDPSTISRLSLGVHTGTHMDAPAHFLEGGSTIDAMPIEATVGPARLLAIADGESIEPRELEPAAIRPGERILFKTQNSGRAWRSETFIKNFVYVSKEAALYLADRSVRCVGIDYLSVGGYEKDAAETHRALLEAGVWIIEGLDFSRVEPGDYELICLPLRLAGAEGAPARAVLGRSRRR